MKLPKTLQRTYDLHQLWLDESNKGIRLDLKLDWHDIDLSGIDLRRANLSLADMRRAHLCEVYLRGACMDRVNLSQADLHQADLSGTDLTECIGLREDITDGR